MGPEDFKAALAEDRALVVGQPATVYWTNCGDAYAGKGVVSKVNAKSLRVRLTEPVGRHDGYEGYPVGREIIVPRITAITRWTWNNCARLRRN